MSHIRNLFHTAASNQGHHPPYSGIAVARESAAAAGSIAVAAPGVSPALVATVPEFAVEQAKITPASRVVFHIDPRGPAADRFRFLRMRLREYWSSGKLKKLLVTSPLAHDGKSTVLLNLATALLERGKRSVLIIEADLHHSSIAQTLQLHTWAGLTECLRDDSISPLSHVRRVDPFGWHLLPAGEPRGNPTELLQTRALGTVIQQLSACFDWVLIDSPPSIPLTDAIALQQHADASLLVVRAGQTPREAVEQTVSLLGPTKLVGIVLNGVERHNQPNYQQRFYGGGQHHED
jgi:capsular exopolysaccharide synthesis family protein